LYVAAASGGQVATLQWLKDNGCPLGSSPETLDQSRWTGAGTNISAECLMCSAAAEAGQLATLQWLIATGCHWDQRVCLQAAAPAQSDGHAAVHAWLVFCFAALPPRYDTFVYIHSLDKLTSFKALALAAAYGYAQVAPDGTCSALERELDAYLEIRDGPGTFKFKSWDWDVNGPAQFVGPSEKYTKLTQKLGQLQPFITVFPQEYMGQLASFEPI
jgi:hypothetical protein